jgi:hypothetical protein
MGFWGIEDDSMVPGNRTEACAIDQKSSTQRHGSSVVSRVTD